MNFADKVFSVLSYLHKTKYDGSENHERWCTSFFISHGFVETKYVLKHKKIAHEIYFDEKNSIKVLNSAELDDGDYIIHNPFNQKSHVPPPDLFLFRIEEGKVSFYLGIECKKTKGKKPTMNDKLMKPFKVGHILYLITTTAKNVQHQHFITVGDIVNSKIGQLQRLSELCDVVCKSIYIVANNSVEQQRKHRVRLGFRRKHEFSSSLNFLSSLRMFFKTKSFIKNFISDSNEEKKEEDDEVDINLTIDNMIAALKALKAE
jgi:hypothetical protein